MESSDFRRIVEQLRRIWEWVELRNPREEKMEKNTKVVFFGGGEEREDDSSR